MQQDKAHLKKALNRYRSGRSDKSERSTIIGWLSSLDLLGNALSPHAIQQEELRSLAGLRAILKPEKKGTVVSLWRWASAVAASLLILAATSLWFYRSTTRSTAPSAKWAEAATSVGEIKKITLTDGSEITLNSMSRLRYPQVFDNGHREVVLSGQGFFKVRHDVKRPFNVHAGKLNIQVLGTEFDVRAYADERAAGVSVASGKVGVMVAGLPTQLLTRGQSLAYGLLTNRFLNNADAAATAGSWQQRRLTFKNQELEKITQEMQRYFKVKFVFNNEQLKQKKINLSIRNQNLQVVMKALSVSGGFRYSIQKDVITLWQ